VSDQPFANGLPCVICGAWDDTKLRIRTLADKRCPSRCLANILASERPQRQLRATCDREGGGSCPIPETKSIWCDSPEGNDILDNERKHLINETCIVVAKPVAFMQQPKPSRISHLPTVWVPRDETSFRIRTPNLRWSARATTVRSQRCD